MYEPKKLTLSLKDKEPGELFMFSYYRAEEGGHGPYIGIIGAEFNEERARKFRDFGSYTFTSEKFGNKKINDLWKRLESFDENGDLTLKNLEKVLIPFLKGKN